MILPCVTKDTGDRGAAIASAITLLAMTAILVAIIVAVIATGR